MDPQDECCGRALNSGSAFEFWGRLRGTKPDTLKPEPATLNP